MTHAHLERVPILENSQDYAELSQNLAEALDQNPPGARGSAEPAWAIYLGAIGG